MSDPLFYIDNYFVNMKRVRDNKPDLSSSEQADLAYAVTCEVIGIFGTIQDLQQITKIHTDYKLMQFEKERGNEFISAS
ncbi:hypothetical protein AB1K91_05120 [Terribacillus sp. 179-K 1B1 HS]|uniref:hypothetical protein n=1 Tax=Terribacillus sp. 179-K 1B1 HS TaxID=3142388 RepID=UPI0039A0E62B